jgi:hypothetical protein
MRRAKELSLSASRSPSHRRHRRSNLNRLSNPSRTAFASVRVRPSLSDIWRHRYRAAYEIGRSVYAREHVIGKDLTKTRPPKPASNLDKNGSARRVFSMASSSAKPPLRSRPQPPPRWQPRHSAPNLSPHVSVKPNSPRWNPQRQTPGRRLPNGSVTPRSPRLAAGSIRGLIRSY